MGQDIGADLLFDTPGTHLNFLAKGIMLPPGHHSKGALTEHKGDFDCVALPYIVAEF